MADTTHHPRQQPGAVVSKTCMNAGIDTSFARALQQKNAATARAKSRWLLAADRLSDANDPTAARHELRELRLYFRELAYAAAAAADGGGLMGRYRKIEVRTWADEKFRSLSPIPPCGQGLWFFLLTGPHTGPIPGLFRAGKAALAEDIGWDQRSFDKAFCELTTAGMVKADFKAKLVWLPKAIHYNSPESPNVVKAWAKEVALLPECSLLTEAVSFIRAYLEGMGEPYAKAFGKPSAKPSGKPSGKAMPNQEQEQEQEQERKSLSRGGILSVRERGGCANPGETDDEFPFDERTEEVL